MQSRFYDANTGRFINADDADYIGINGGIVSNNLFAYCDNDPINNTDPNGCFVIKRWMISTPIDIILSLIPGIGAAFAPIKSLAKSYGKAALKTKLRTPLASFIRFIAKSASKLIKGLVKVVRKIPFVGKWIASKIPVNKLIKTIAGAASSSTINWILKKVASNIDVVLSIGGAIAGILDIAFDKKLNNSIWVI